MNGLIHLHPDLKRSKFKSNFCSVQTPGPHRMHMVYKFIYSFINSLPFCQSQQCQQCFTLNLCPIGLMVLIVHGFRQEAGWQWLMSGDFNIIFVITSQQRCSYYFKYIVIVWPMPRHIGNNEHATKTDSFWLFRDKFFFLFCQVQFDLVGTCLWSWVAGRLNVCVCAYTQKWAFTESLLSLHLFLFVYLGSALV